ncbi:MAG TPA: hypothetical protein VFT16_04920 [Candidatus Saccharimonadales bacterium]|nr:hypothetical protein [Candidatus Saccharimonadales bacterium]
MDDKAQPISVHNAVTLSSNGALLVLLTEPQTAQSMVSLEKELTQTISDLRSRQKEVLILADVSRVRQYDPEILDIMKNIVERLDFDSMAIFGGSPSLYAAARKYVAESNQQVKIHLFDSAEEAARWLAGDVIQQASSERALAHPIWPPRRKKRTI